MSMPRFLLKDNREGRAGGNIREMAGRIDIQPDPVIEAFKKGVDRTLLRANLKLTPEQRLRKMHAAARGLAELRAAIKNSRR
jgi:hypothetical protein